MPVRHELRVEIDGQGVIMAGPVGLSCPGTCATQVAPNTFVELFATPADGWQLTGWSGACAGTTTERCTLTITQDTAATAHFVQLPELRIARTGSGSGNVSSRPGEIRCGTGGACAQRFAPGTSVILAAEAFGDSVFRGWSGGCAGSETPCTVTVNRDVEVTARFERRQQLVAIDELTDELVVIHPETLTTTRIGPVNVPYRFGDCAWNPADATLYMIDGDGNRALYRINLATGAASLVGTHGIEALEAIAFAPSTSRFYSASLGPTLLFSMSPTTGAPTMLAPIGPNFQGMAWDVARDRMVAFDGSAMFSVDLANGVMNQLTTIGARIASFGMTYSSDIDRFWVVDLAGRLTQFNPNLSFARTNVGTLPGSYTCVASIPAP